MWHQGRPKITCCRGCTERVADPNCHGYCERYLNQRAALDQTNAEVRKKQKVNLGIKDQKYDLFDKVDRAKGRKKK